MRSDAKADSHFRWCCVEAALALAIVSCSKASPTHAAVIADGATGAVDGTSPEASAVDDEEDTSAAGASPWAAWPMPNPVGVALPNEARYTVAAAGADETVRDDVTGLIWQRSVGARGVSLQQALTYCTDLTFDGHRDWRLPSRVELVSLVDFTHSMELAQPSPAIDIVAFPDTEGAWFWSSSLKAEDPGNAWYVYFYFGYIDADAVRSAFNARCVRAGAPRPDDADNRYELGAATARDRGTGLTWQRTDSGDHYTFADAQTYCEKLRLGGAEGWRVPTMKELPTIVDESHHGPALDPATFPAATAERFWTSSVFAADASLAWYVEFDYGSGLYGLATNAYRVRCVR